MTRAPHYAIAAIVVAALTLAISPFALKRSQQVAPVAPTPLAVTVVPTAHGFAVTPSSVTVTVGQQLSLANRDTARHSLVQVSGPHAQVVDDGQTDSVEFSQVGRYSFSIVSGSGDAGAAQPLTVTVTR
jgi:plastocyanin